MRKTKISGAALATAVALMFASGAVYAAGDSGSSTSQVKCVGGNSCKGQSACKSASSDCKGQNSCKGKGFVMTTSAEECQKDGGKPEKPSKSDMM
jgi:hypothetical protein